MAKDNKKYTIDDDSQSMMVGEPAAVYASRSEQNRIVLTVPEGIDAEPLREKVNAYYHAILHEYIVEQEFRKNLDNWLYCTGMYSGPNLCWDNAPFRSLESMGSIALPMIDRIRVDYPDYTQRHIGWLRRKLES